MVRRKQPKERGFALLIVVLIVALLAITGAMLLDMVSLELDMVGQQRRILRARHIADGGTFELLAQEGADTNFPDLQTMTTNIPPPPSNDSLFHNMPGTSLEERYNGEYRLIRFSPVLDNSNLMRAITYELEVDSEVNQGQASSRSTVELVVFTGKLGGGMLTISHAR